MYGVISVIYHALQGAETYGSYIRDAEQAEDDELVAFFKECREEEVARAERGKQLLSARLEDYDESDDEDEEDEEDEE
jgi:hypothetical protein